LNLRWSKSPVINPDFINRPLERIVVAREDLSRTSDGRVGIGAGSQGKSGDGLLQGTIDIELRVG